LFSGNVVKTDPGDDAETERTCDGKRQPEQYHFFRLLSVRYSSSTNPKKTATRIKTLSCSLID